MTSQEAADNARRRYRVALDLLKDERRYTAALNADGFMTQAAR